MLRRIMSPKIVELSWRVGARASIGRQFVRDASVAGKLSGIYRVGSTTNVKLWAQAPPHAIGGLAGFLPAIRLARLRTVDVLRDA